MAEKRLRGIHTAHKTLSAYNTNLLKENARKALGPYFVECNINYISILYNNVKQLKEFN
jgi:hypothetical protein